jgi:hypothetical protein
VTGRSVYMQKGTILKEIQLRWFYSFLI